MNIPTIGIGAGADCDAQVLVWQDMAGLSPRTPKFVKRYADVGKRARPGRPLVRAGGRGRAVPAAGARLPLNRALMIADAARHSAYKRP